MLIEETTEYDELKIHDCNRKIDEASVQSLMVSIKDKNMLKSKPIIVDKDFYIIDGQHRYEAAKRLGIPIPYCIDTSTTIQDIIRLNVNQKSWSVADYLNFFCNQNFEEYIKLNRFIRDNKIPLNVALQLLNGDRSSKFFTKFKNGNYQFPEEADFLDSIQKMKNIRETIDFIKKKTSGPKTYLERVTFYGALVEFYNIQSFSHEIFLNKIGLRPNLMGSRARQCDYVSLFKEIYNYRSKQNSRIEDDFET